MDNITGSGKSWLNGTNNPVQSKATEEVVVEKKVLNVDAIKELVSRMEDTYCEIDKLYQEKPTKNISDSAVMLSRAIASMRNNLTNN
jgi:hypothetical protein